MTEFIKMDVFFVVTTAAVVVLAAFVIAILFRIVRILKNVERLSDIVTEEGELLKTDINDVRANIRAEGFKWKHVTRFVRHTAQRFAGKK